MTTAADLTARIGSTMTATMVASDAAQIKRLVEFAAEVHEPANERRDLELRALIDDLVRDLTFDDKED